MSDGSEKRRFKRIKRAFAIRVKPEREGLPEGRIEKWDLVTIHNLSAGGLSFNYSERLKTGTILELKIELPFVKEPVSCHAQVTRTEEVSFQKTGVRKIVLFRIAAEFIEIDLQEKKAIDEYILKQG